MHKQGNCIRLEFLDGKGLAEGKAQSSGRSYCFFKQRFEILADVIWRSCFFAAFASEGFMPRPTILVAESEPNDALSVRKLVLESAKFNVLTAHSTRECLDTFQLFPKITLAILVKDGTIDLDLVASEIKKVATHIPIIALTPRVAEKCDAADYTLSSHDPEELVGLVRSLAGDPRAMKEGSR